MMNSNYNTESATVIINHIQIHTGRVGACLQHTCHFYVMLKYFVFSYFNVTVQWFILYTHTQNLSVLFYFS